MTTLEKILQRRDEEIARKKAKEEKRKAKEAEREAKKKAAKREKILAKRAEKKRKQKQAQNQRYYARKRAAVLAEKHNHGDKRAWHMVVLMKDRKYVKRLACAWWRTDAYEKYDEIVRKNHAEVLFPLQVVEPSQNMREQNGRIEVPTEYEVLLIQKNDSSDANERKFRDKETGKFIENVIVGGNVEYTILKKDDWLVEETFAMYGRHPLKERVDAHYILDELVMCDAVKENLRRVYTYKNVLIIQYDENFEAVMCKDDGEAARLYTMLMKQVGKKNKYILFTGKIDPSSNTARWICNEIEKNTGRDARTIAAR